MEFFMAVGLYQAGEINPKAEQDGNWGFDFIHTQAAGFGL
jgi:hypothetical protein